MDSTAADMDSASDRSSGWTRRSFLGLASAATFVGLAGCSSQSSTSPSSDGSQLAVNRDGYAGDAFAGSLTDGVGSSEPAEADPGTYEGVVVYDRSCEPVGDGLTGCDAGIETQELGTVNFYYEHDMHQKPCLVPDQSVVFEVKNERTVVQRKS